MYLFDFFPDESPLCNCIPWLKVIAPLRCPSVYDSPLVFRNDSHSHSFQPWVVTIPLLQAQQYWTILCSFTILCLHFYIIVPLLKSPSNFPLLSVFLVPAETGNRNPLRKYSILSILLYLWWWGHLKTILSHTI